MGIFLVVPLAFSAFMPDIGADPFQLSHTPPFDGWPGLIMVSVIALYLYRLASSDASADRDVEDVSGDHNYRQIGQGKSLRKNLSRSGVRNVPAVGFAMGR